MASYRPFPPQSTFPAPASQPPANQNHIHPQPQQQQQQQQRPNQYAQNYSNPMAPPAPSSAFPQNYPTQQNFPPQHYPPPPRSQQHPPPPPQYAYQPPPPPPPPESSYPPPPPPPAAAPSQQPPSMYYPTSQYPQYGHQPMQPPPPPLPSSPPPSSSIPPPPPPSSPPPPPPKESGSERIKGVSRERREHGHSNHGVGVKQHHQKAPLPHMARKVNGPQGRVETEEERRLRKKREFEKQRQEEKHRQQLKESQNSVLQKSQMLSAQKGHSSIVGSRIGDRRAAPLLGGERIENRLKKPTTFLCKLKFRNELPDPSAQPKFMTIPKDKDRFTRYTITSLEKMYKPQLYVEPDLGIPLDLLDLSVYNPPRGVRPPLAPEDEELLRDDESTTPVKKDGIKRKERPTDKGVSWLVKTQYISPLSMESTKQSLSEKQAKELREMKGRNLLENLNNRERQIKEIEASFEACKLAPVHATNKSLRPVKILPLVPDFDRYDDKFVTMTFDGAPTADSEFFNKLDQSARDAYESRAIMKACVASGPDPANPEKFLAYMVPSPNELSKDIYDENEDTSYSWIREYHWDVRGDDANDPSTFLVSFDETEARYLPLPTKINLRRKRAIDGRAGDEVEHFPIPSRITARRRPTAATIEMRDSGVVTSLRGNASSSRMGRLDEDDEDDDGLRRTRRMSRHQDDVSEDDVSE